MKKLFTAFLLSLLLLSFKAENTFAAGCAPIYGGGQSCPDYSFSIQKQVQKPGKGGGDFVNNLSINDPKYAPSQNVTCQVTIRNTGSKKIPTITVVDAFPKYLSFVSGPGNYNSKSNNLVFTVSGLNIGQEATYTIVGKLVNSNNLPNDQGVICELNQVTATDSSGSVNKTSSQFCLQKDVLAAQETSSTSTTKGGLKVMAAPELTTTPATGPEMVSLALIIPAALSGLLLRRRSKQSLNRGGEK